MNFKKFALRYIFKIVYIFAIGSIIPLSLALDIEPKLSFFVKETSYLMLIAMILLLISVIGEFMNQGTLPKTLKSIGRMTLIPASIALVVVLIGKETLLILIDRFGVGNLKIIIEYYLTKLPNAFILIISYLALGLLLYLLGKSMA